MSWSISWEKVDKSFIPCSFYYPSLHYSFLLFLRSLSPSASVSLSFSFHVCQHFKRQLMSFLKFSCRILFLFLFLPHDALFAGFKAVEYVENRYLSCRYKYSLLWLYIPFIVCPIFILDVALVLIVSPVEIFSYCGAHTLPEGEGYRYHINQIQ